MTDKKVKKLLNNKDFDLEQEVLTLSCVLSVIYDKTDEELLDQYGVGFNDFNDYNEEKLSLAYINLYNDVNELKRKPK